jgi:hypothetical protein
VTTATVVTGISVSTASVVAEVGPSYIPATGDVVLVMIIW